MQYKNNIKQATPLTCAVYKWCTHLQQPHPYTYTQTHMHAYTHTRSCTQTLKQQSKLFLRIDLGQRGVNVQPTNTHKPVTVWVSKEQLFIVHVFDNTYLDKFVNCQFHYFSSLQLMWWGIVQCIDEILQKFTYIHNALIFNSSFSLSVKYIEWFSMKFATCCGKWDGVDSYPTLFIQLFEQLSPLTLRDPSTLPVQNIIELIEEA